ncbi:hypothetical protein ACH5RR_035865 [Cinchona calisaya]|uniref:Uncharacterized protein n=1 Tax=Cinchona calisaya TaxID=153742 RepID=A0ABD2Y3X2_9GENT
MVISIPRTFVILIYIGLLAVHPDNVCAIRNIGIVLRWNREGHSLILHKNQRILKAAVMKGALNTEIKAPPAVNKKTDDPFQSSKRKVGRGSDPIHNRS